MSGQCNFKIIALVLYQIDFSKSLKLLLFNRQPTTDTGYQLKVEVEGLGEEMNLKFRFFFFSCFLETIILVVLLVNQLHDII